MNHTMSKWNLAGRVAVITGASSGIGRQLAYDLADRGMKLALAARNRSVLEEVAAACRSRLGAGRDDDVIVVPTDVAELDACRALMTRTIEAFGGIDLMVANAGISMWARFDEIEDVSIFERIMKINYLGAVYCTRFAYKSILARKGLFVAISSLTGKTGVPTRSAYAASKHAMQGFYDSLRVEIRNTGAEVLVVSPGFVATEVRERALGPDGQPLGHSKRDEASGTMTVEECVRQIVVAIEKRERDLAMVRGGHLLLAAGTLMPRRIDDMTAKAVSDPGVPGDASTLMR